MRLGNGFSRSASYLSEKPSAIVAKHAAVGIRSPPRAAFSHSASDGSDTDQPCGSTALQRSLSQAQKAHASCQLTQTTGRFSGPRRAAGWCAPDPLALANCANCATVTGASPIQ
jgi:hypothetical protein